ncbi:hypothetical protein TP40_07895 [Xanthomonas citri pv. citri]|nr:hypothetical protein TP44_00200 [Xanthomonas citri pv. citri]PWF16685.1 hypothetical protein TP40_07895 [Xanthomonas citri pv. citri]
MLARAKCEQAMFQMFAVWGRNVDDVDVRVADERLVAVVSVFHRPGVGERLRTFAAARGYREWTLAGIATQGIDECGCDLARPQHTPAQYRFAVAWQEQIRRRECRRQHDDVLCIGDVAMLAKCR